MRGGLSDHVIFVLLLSSTRFALRDALLGERAFADEIQYRVQRTAEELLEPNGGWITVTSSQVMCTKSPATRHYALRNWINLFDALLISR